MSRWSERSGSVPINAHRTADRLTCLPFQARCRLLGTNPVTLPRTPFLRSSGAEPLRRFTDYASTWMPCATFLGSNACLNTGGAFSESRGMRPERRKPATDDLHDTLVNRDHADGNVVPSVSGNACLPSSIGKGQRVFAPGRHVDIFTIGQVAPPDPCGQNSRAGAETQAHIAFSS